MYFVDEEEVFGVEVDLNCINDIEFPFLGHEEILEVFVFSPLLVIVGERAHDVFVLRAFIDQSYVLFNDCFLVAGQSEIESVLQQLLEINHEIPLSILHLQLLLAGMALCDRSHVVGIVQLLLRWCFF